MPRSRPTSAPWTIVVGGLLLALLVGCSSGTSEGGSGGSTTGSTGGGGTTAPATTPGTAESGTVPAAPDYADASSWLAEPNPSAHPVDVFYLYPTVWSRPGGTGPMTAAIDDPTMRNGAQTALQGQASAFSPVANVFAPYYRQASGEVIAMSQAEREAIVGGIPTADAVAAFDYYLTYLNQGRPFILAGHSQGSNLLVNLLTGYLKDHPTAYARMIASYVIGYSITNDDLVRYPYLKFAERADDVGVLVSYNTESPDVTGANPVVLPGALAINPISWTRSEAEAPASHNLGSYITNPDGSMSFVDDLADAQVDLAKGVVVCSTCNVARFSNPNPAVPQGVFHTNDYAFYYFDLRDNAAERVAVWARTH